MYRACALLTVSAFLLAMALPAHSASKWKQMLAKAKREDGVKPGCCPPSYTMKYCLANNGSEDQCGKVYYWNSELPATAVNLGDVYYVTTEKYTAQVDNVDNCWYTKDALDSTPSWFEICLLSNAVYEGLRDVQFPDGRVLNVQVYTMGDEKIERYYLPDETKCTPIGEKWYLNDYHVFYTVESVKYDVSSEIFNAPSKCKSEVELRYQK